MHLIYLWLREYKPFMNPPYPTTLYIDEMQFNIFLYQLKPLVWLVPGMIYTYTSSIFFRLPLLLKIQNKRKKKKKLERSFLVFLSITWNDSCSFPIICNIIGWLIRFFLLYYLFNICYKYFPLLSLIWFEWLGNVNLTKKIKNF